MRCALALRTLSQAGSGKPRMGTPATIVPIDAVAFAALYANIAADAQVAGRPTDTSVASRRKVPPRMSQPPFSPSYAPVPPFNPQLAKSRLPLWSLVIGGTVVAHGIPRGWAH